MKRFRKVKGSTTVFLIFIFLTIMLLAAGIIALLRFRWEKTQMQRLSDISAETELGKYYRPLFDEYRLFYYMDSGPETMEADLMGSFLSNQENAPGLLRLSPSALTITDRHYAIDDNCNNVLKQIKDSVMYCCAEGMYEKFRKEFLKNTGEYEDSSEELEDISEEVKQCEEDAAIEEDVLELLKLVEGITVSGGSVYGHDVYVKQGIYGELTAENAGIDESLVWNAVIYRDFDIKADMKKLIKKAKKAAAGDYVLYPSIDVGSLTARLERILEKDREALAKADEIIKEVSGRSDVKLICDPVSVKKKISDNIRILEKVLELKDISAPKNVDDWKEILNRLNEYEELFRGYHIKDIRFDYSTLNKNKASDPRKKGGFIGDGILSYLVDNEEISRASMTEAKVYEKLYGKGKTDSDPGYSDKEIDFNDTKGLDGFLNECRSEGIHTQFTDKIDMQLYIDMFFGDYMDGTKGDGDKNNVRYEKEYIIAGKDSDIDNLRAVANRLILIRSGETFIYIVKNSSYRAEAYAAAAALVGFTGMDALVRCVQYMLIGLWSYEDACIDVGIMLSGKKIPLIKKALNISFPEIVLFTKNYVKGKIESAADYGEVNYERSVQVLLASVNDGTKLCRIMDLIQMKMKSVYDNRFSFQDALYGMDVCYSCGKPFGYTISSSYSYR